MSLRITIDLDEDDLKHFELIMHEARNATRVSQPDKVVASAEALLVAVGTDRVPEFVRERLAKLKLMIEMLRDQEWRLPKQDATRVLNALAYFAEPEDLIPDHIPGIGYLDDAIMVELVVRELRHEIEAYVDFCEFRRNSPTRGIKKKSTDVTREEWLDERRNQLQQRMRRRRKKGGGVRDRLGLSKGSRRGKPLT